jgi:hypothetical protein
MNRAVYILSCMNNMNRTTATTTPIHPCDRCGADIFPRCVTDSGATCLNCWDKHDRTFAADIAQMMADWNAATPQQREGASGYAAALADAAHQRLLHASKGTV